MITMPMSTGRLDFHAIAFDVAAFHSAAFIQADLACPPHIARSVRKRQAEFYHGRLAARAALVAWGMPADTVSTAANGAPVWPAGVVGSISHCSWLAIAAVAAASELRGLGLDVEPVVTADHRDSLLALVLNGREQALLRTLDISGRLPFHAGLTLAFSAKESFYKAVSAVAGRVLEFDAIEIIGLDAVDAGGRLHFETIEAISAAWPSGRRGQIDYMWLASGELVTAFAW